MRCRGERPRPPGRQAGRAAASRAGTALQLLRPAPAMSGKALPKMVDVPAADRTALFKQKLAICAVVFDFMEPETAERDAKRQVLLECIEYISKKNVLTEAIYSDALHMVRQCLSVLVLCWCTRACALKSHATAHRLVSVCSPSPCPFAYRSPCLRG